MWRWGLKEVGRKDPQHPQSMIKAPNTTYTWAFSIPDITRAATKQNKEERGKKQKETQGGECTINRKLYSDTKK